MRYPNIAAEYEASQTFRTCSPKLFTEILNVSYEIAAGIIAGNEEPLIGECRAMLRIFDYMRSGLGIGYLLSPEPSLMPYERHRREKYIYELRFVLDLADSIGLRRYSIQRGGSKKVLEALEAGKPVTYAMYRHAKDQLRHVKAAIMDIEHKRRKPPRREVTAFAYLEQLEQLQLMKAGA